MICNHHLPASVVLEPLPKCLPMQAPRTASYRAAYKQPAPRAGRDSANPFAFGPFASEASTLFAAVIALIVQVMTGCSPPRLVDNLAWNSQLFVPFGVSTYGMWDMVEPDTALRRKGSGIGMNGDSSLYFTSFTNVQIRLENTLDYDPYSFVSIKPRGMEDSTTRNVVENQRHRLIRGVISEGSVTVRLTHDPPDRTDTATVTLPNLTDSRGQPLVVQRILAGVDADTFSVDLTEYQLTLDSTGVQYFAARLQASADARLVAEVEVHRLVFREYSAFVNNLVINSEDHWTLVEQLPEGWEAVHPVSVDAYVRLPRSFTGVGELITDVSTYLNSQQIGAARIYEGNINFARDTTIVGHVAPQLIATFPHQVLASSRLNLNGYVLARANDVLRMTVELRAPIEFWISQLNPPGDVQKIDTEDLQDVISGTARVRIWNRLPVGGRVFIVMDRDSSRVLQRSGASVDTVADVTVPVGPIVNRRSTAEAYTETLVPLTEHVLDMLKHPPFFSRLDLYIPGTDGDTLIAHGTDYIRVQVIGEIEYRVELGGD